MNCPKCGKDTGNYPACDSCGIYFGGQPAPPEPPRPESSAQSDITILPPLGRADEYVLRCFEVIHKDRGTAAIEHSALMAARMARKLIGCADEIKQEQWGPRNMKPAKSECAWSFEGDAGTGDSWVSGCGVEQILAHGDRPDAAYDFCPHCGDGLVQFDKIDENNG